MTYKIGVDGGGTKTECILVDATGRVVGRHTAAGCNPSVVGAATASSILRAALAALRAQASVHRSAHTSSQGDADTTVISDILLCMAGSRGVWQELAAGLTQTGRVTCVDDSLPILELATNGQPGLALHAGTGSFVAARAPDGSIHYGGGVGWRFGDAGSGYDIGAQAIKQSLLELQGWAPASRLGPAVLDYAQLPKSADASAVTRHFYAHEDATRHIAALTPVVLRLATERDETAKRIVGNSTGALLDLAFNVATKLFPASALKTIPVGLSGPILNHPLVLKILAARSSLPLVGIVGAPIEGVRLMLARL